MALPQEQIRQFVHRLPFFNGLPESDIEDFLARARIREYDKNRLLFRQGDAARCFFIIISGWIKLYRMTPEGEEAIAALFTRDDVFGEAAIFGGTAHPFSAAAAEDSLVIEMSSDMLREKARANPDIMVRVMDSMSRVIHNLQMEHEHMALMSAPQRVACLLLQLTAGMFGKGGTFSFPYDKSLAATRLGMTPETFSRALGQLRDVDVTVKGAEICIGSFERLADYCCAHCSAQPDECCGRRGSLCGALNPAFLARQQAGG